MKKSRMKTGGERLRYRFSALAVAGILVLIPVLVSLCGIGELHGADVYASERTEGEEDAGDGRTFAAEVTPAGSTSGISSPGDSSSGDEQSGDTSGSGTSSGSKEEGENAGGGDTSAA